jgi:hypothetical protein
MIIDVATKISKNPENNLKRISRNTRVVVHQYPSFMEFLTNQFRNISENNWAIWISLILLVITVIVIFPNYGDDNDIWFHLAYGKQYVTHLTWHIDQSQFSWTPVDVTDWIYGTWLGSSVMYLVYELGGISGLCVMQWLILIAVLLMIAQYARLLHDRLDLFRIMSLMLTAIVLKLTQVYLKPQMISTLLFSVTVFLYFNSTRQQNYKTGRFFLYPVIFLLWVNIHGEFMVGLAFLSVAFTGELIAAIIYKNYDKLKNVLIPFGTSILVSFAVTIINPDGIRYPISIIKVWLTERDPVSKANVSVLSMWNYIGFHMQNYNFVNAADVIVFMGVLLVIFSLIAIHRTRRLNIPVLLLNIAFFYLSMKAARATLFFPVVWCYSIYTLMAEADLWDIKRKLTPFFMGIFAFAAVYSLYLMVITMPYATWLGYHFDDYFPKKEVEFIKRYHLPGPVFNDYLLGGYMMWTMYPEYKVWIDPRSGPYIKEVLPDWLTVTGNLNEANFKYLTTKYPFKIALIGMWRSDVIFWFLKSPDWKLIYFDKCAAVLINKSVIPSLPPAALTAEVGTKRFSDLSNPLILNNLFQFYILVGPSYARDIRSFYAQNVSNWFQGKKETLAAMDAAIHQKELQLQQQKAGG